MKNAVKRIAALALALVMLFAMTACGSSAAEELKYSQDIVVLMNELTEQGKAIIMISSELPEVLGMSDRVLVMHGGQIKGELTGDDMTAEKVMKLAID